jgi:hypothetical protein
MSFSAWSEMSCTQLVKRKLIGKGGNSTSIHDVAGQGRISLATTQGRALVVIRGRNILGQSWVHSGKGVPCSRNLEQTR